MRLIGIAAILGLFMPLSAAFGQSSTREGTISNIYLSAGTNFGIRVYLLKNGVNQLSDCPGFWAYVNKDFDNYELYASSIITSYAQGKKATLVISKDAGGYCRIGEFGF